MLSREVGDALWFYYLTDRVVVVVVSTAAAYIIPWLVKRVQKSV